MKKAFAVGMAAMVCGLALLAPSASAALKRCNYPAAIATPSWVPGDLPLPAGTYAYRDLKMEGGYHRAKFVLPVRTPRFARMVLRKWPKHGWTLGRGDSEPGEVEDSFLKSPAAGAFKANDVNCSGGKTILYLVFNPTATS